MTLNQIIQKYQDELDYCEDKLSNGASFHETTRNYWEGRIESFRAILRDLTEAQS